ncbi:MAG: tetratricopeptide repeat protein [Sedimentisphaerales bacterium]|nr:tetratricopeptide repeat protein [Sedimentisphaerales bacterium]
MSCLLELLGKGLESHLMFLVLPGCGPLSQDEVKHLEEALIDDPSHKANILRLGIHYTQCGSNDRAQHTFSELLKKHPDYLEAYLAWAAMHAADGELEEALELLKKAALSSTKDSRILYALGHCYERMGKLEEALNFYHESSNCTNYFPKARQRLAAIYYLEGDYEETILQCQKLQKDHPEEVWNYLVLGYLYLQIGQYNKAEESFERALTIEPDNFELHDDQVEALAQAGQIQEAIIRMEEIIEEQGDFPNSYVRLADLYSQLGDDELAVKYYNRALEIHPGYLEAAVKLGTQHLRMGRYNKAAARFNEAVEINDQLIGAYIGLGLAQNLSEHPSQEQSHDTFDLASALEPNTNLLFAEMNRLQLKVAQAQKSMKNLEEASIACLDEDTPDDKIKDLIDIQIERYKNKLIQNPNHADLHYRFGLLMYGKGLIDQAIEHFQKALSINPSFFKVQTKLGLALWGKGQFGPAIENFKKAFRLDQELVELHYKLGVMYCDKIQFALAVEHFKDIMDDNNNNSSTADVQANISLALQNMGLIDRAAASWRTACELEPQSTLAFQAQRAITSLKNHLF